MGTRVAKEEVKQKKTLSKGALGGIIVGAVVVVLAVAYIILCVVAGGSKNLPNGTTVNGVDLSGQTAEQAYETLTRALEDMAVVNGKDYSAVEVTPQSEGAQSYTVVLADALDYDVSGAVDQAFSYSSGFFLTRGVRYLSALSGKEYYQYPGIMAQEAVADAVEQSGILELNTVVEPTWTLGEETLDVTTGTGGVAVDKDALVTAVVDYVVNGTAIVCPMVDTQPSTLDMQAIRDEVYAEPANATLDVAEDNSYTIVESVRGVDFDVAGAESMIAAAAEGATVQIPLDREEPTIDTANLEECLFRDVLGEYTTNVSGSSNRKGNVKLCGEKINGTILLPGEEFSYNNVVGQRTVEAGFKEAGAYLNGKEVQEVGGGVCQGSSTLYCAVMYANLEVVNRRNHSFISSYVPLGMDATVSWGGPDFVFKNDTDYPIMVVASYANSKLTVEIHGTVVEEFTVKITRGTPSYIAKGREEIPDDTLYVGQEVVEDSGHTGCKVQTYREVYDADGNLVSKTEESYSSYIMTNEVVRVGTKVKEPEVTEETTTGEGEQSATETETTTEG